MTTSVVPVTAAVGAISLAGTTEWLVPAFVTGVPGLLIVLVAVLQLLGGALWLPAVRRLRRQPHRRPRPPIAPKPSSPSG